MPKFSDKSRARLDTCHPDIVAVLLRVIARRDCTIIEGVRTKERQAELVRTGKSKTMNSRHLMQADGYSHAVDVGPWPLDWDDSKAFALFAGYVMATADEMHARGEISHTLTWGGDWDNDGATRDHSFFDGPHFQLRT